MTFATGNTTNANSGQTFLAAIDVTLTAEPGISKVNAALVVGTFTWNVYKSAAGTNSLGQDFYFALGYPTTGANSVVATVMEGWNNSTLLASNYAPGVSNVTPAANFANPAAASNLPSSGANIAYLQTSNIPATFSYAYSVTANRVHFEIFAAAGAVAAGISLGLYDSVLPATVDPFPLMCVNQVLNGSSGNALSNAAISRNGFGTREPNTLVASTNNFAVGCGGAAANSWTLVAAAVDVYNNNNYYMGRQALFGRVAATGLRGLVKDTFFGPVQVQNGDAISWTVNGVSYTATRMTGSALGVYFLNA